MLDDFAVFILTHGRPDRVHTFNTLERSGYTGKLFLVIDDDDETGPEYIERFGAGRVLIFNKEKVGESFDKYDNSGKRNGIAWARNVCWDLAEQVKVKHFLQLDDDYTNFSYRRPGRKDGVWGYHGWTIRNLDEVFEALVAFVKDTPVKTVAMSQGGDHFGAGVKEIDQIGRSKRKAMNSFVCDTARRIQFPGRLNEDVNAYVRQGELGDIFLTYMPLQLSQLPTQSNEGGMTDIYLEGGTYVKSFFTVLASPSCVTVRLMGQSDNSKRLHHHINWPRAVPRIIPEKLRR